MTRWNLMMLTPLIAWLGYRSLRPDWVLITRNNNPIDEFWQTDMIWLIFIGLGSFALIAMIYALGAMIYQALKMVLSPAYCFYFSIRYPLHCVPICLCTVISVCHS